MLLFILVSLFLHGASGFSLKAAPEVSSSSFRKYARLKMATETAVFGMGCFWAPQKLFDSKEGVMDTKVGYTGGENANPSYTSVCSGDGHIEAVRVEFDNDVVSYDDLLDVFYKQDRQTLMGQTGQYQSAIFTTSEEQMARALDRGDNNGLTTIKEKQPFYVAESYHQQYEAKQAPRIAWLLTGFVIDVIPNLPTDVYKVGAFMTGLYVVLFLYERFLQPAVSGKLERVY